jgi:ribonuclease-3
MPSHEISALEELLGYRFRDRALIEQALTHSSYAREAESQAVADEICLHQADNEQMEFLGDAVLCLVVSQDLFRRFPEYTEGELSKLRAHIVSARHLVRPAHKLEIGRYLRLGKGEDRSGGRSKSALLVNALEALIAALYLDGGLEPAQRFIRQAVLEPELADLQRGSGKRLPVTDYKSALQEVVHALGRPQPRYVLVKEEGPEHRKVFTIEAHISAANQGAADFVCRAEGNTKKRAEQVAAREAWEYLQSLERGSGGSGSRSTGETSKHS